MGRASKLVAYSRRVISAHGRAFVRRLPLAPGRLVYDDTRDRTELTFLLDCAATYGPIFRIWSAGEVTTCIVGHAAGKRFLSENSDQSYPFSVDLRPVFPHGTLRAMQGEQHRAYRRKFVEAFRATPFERHRAAIEESIRTALDHAAALPGPVSMRELRAVFKEASTSILMRMLLGITRESPAYRLLPEQLDRFGPTGPIDEIDAIAAGHFNQIRKTVQAEIDRRDTSATVVPSLLGHLLAAGTLDETLLGNLIQTLQTGRYDLLGLLFWLTEFLAGAPAILARIRDRNDGPAGPRNLATAAVLETLRLSQSEYLRRRATTDIVFDGFLIPRGSLVRICIWEGHRDPASFGDPTAFLPDRFLDKEYPLTAYAPFGLDHHRCPGADWTVDISTMFAETLARGYRLALASVGPPVGGHHHFEPGPGFAVRLDRLTTDELTVADA